METGNAIQLNGIDQYIQLDETVHIGIENSSNRSEQGHIGWREYWNTTGDKPVFSSNSGEYFRWIYESGIQKAELQLLNESGVKLTGLLGGDIPTGQWTNWQLDFTWEGLSPYNGSVKLYRDSVLDGEFVYSGRDGVSGGMDVDNIGYLSGDYSNSIFSDFSIHPDSNWSSSDIEDYNANHYPGEDIREDLWYRLNDVDVVGGIITDYSASGRNATLINSNIDAYYTGIVPFSFRPPVEMLDYKIITDTNTSGTTISNDIINSSGDMLVVGMHLFYENASGSSAGVNEFDVTAPSGWIIRTVDNGGPDTSIGLFFKLSTGNETGDYEFTWDVPGTTGIPEFVALSLFSFSGVEQGWTSYYSGGASNISNGWFLPVNANVRRESIVLDLFNSYSTGTIAYVPSDVNSIYDVENDTYDAYYMAGTRLTNSTDRLLHSPDKVGGTQRGVSLELFTDSNNINNNGVRSLNLGSSTNTGTIMKPIKITSTINPIAREDTYPTHESIFGLGGFKKCVYHGRKRRNTHRTFRGRLLG